MNTHPHPPSPSSKDEAPQRSYGANAVAAFRQKKREAGLIEIRGVFAPVEHAEHIRKVVRAYISQLEKNGAKKSAL